MKLLKTIRFDGSDDFVFSAGAPPDEWAVSGSVAFVGITKSDLIGKTRQEFANGFLGLPSFGRSTFASVADVGVEETEEIRRTLSGYFRERLGAPNDEEARAAAEAEVLFAADLCMDVPINTVFTLRRVLNDQGEIAEEFRTITPPTGEPLHARVWNVEHDDV